MHIIKPDIHLNRCISHVRCLMLKKILLFIAGFIPTFQAHSNEVEVLRWFYGPQKSFAIMAPVTWKENQSNPELFNISAPNDVAGFTGSAYKFNSETNLTTFASARFSGVMEFYKPVESDIHAAIDGTEIVIRQFEGNWPGEKKVTSYIVACATSGEIYASISLTLDKSDFIKKKAVYIKMLETIRVGKST
jgi:hypothetical protein